MLNALAICLGLFKLVPLKLTWVIFEVERFLIFTSCMIPCFFHMLTFFENVERPV